MVQECIDNDEKEESFQGMYDPGEDSNADNNDDNDVCNNSAGEEENSDTLSKNDNMNDQAIEHVEWVEAKVRHQSMHIAWDWNADWHVHDGIVLHEQQCIELLPQTMHIVQEHWKQLYDKEEHYWLQHTIIDELKNKTLISKY